MSVETITIVISAIGLLLGFVGVIGWLIKRTDEQFTALRSDLGGRIAAVERELGDVKIAIARLEGPRPHFVPAR